MNENKLGRLAETVIMMPMALVAGILLTLIIVLYAMLHLSIVLHYCLFYPAIGLVCRRTGVAHKPIKTVAVHCWREFVFTVQDILDN